MPHPRNSPAAGTAPILDLYAGAGGWDVGAAMLGLPTVGLEIKHDPCVTAVRAGHPRIRCDVATYPTAPFTGKLAGLVASPPCQAWSMAGKRLGEQDKTRVHRLVDRYAVLGLWRHIGDVLRGWGYSVSVRVLCAADYGVPQTRDRAVLIASRVRRVHQPIATHYDPTHGMSLFGTPWVTIAEALGWDGVDRPARTITGNRAPRWAYDQANSYSTGWTLTHGAQPNATARTPDQPAATIVCSRPGNLRWTGEEGTRQVGHAEAAILQGFRPDYPWHGNKTSRFHQIANAVPPGLAAAVIAVAAGLPAAAHLDVAA